jgi:hypothetical protein
VTDSIPKWASFNAHQGSHLGVMKNHRKTIEKPRIVAFYPNE